MDDPTDREQIRDLVCAYARALDRMDGALLASLFHSDAELDYGGFKGSAAEFCAMAMRTLGALKATQHNMLNSLISVDGDQASAETYAMNYHGFLPGAGSQDFVSFVRYVDRIEQRDGAWRFARREFFMSGRQSFPAETRLGVLSADPPPGERNAEDPSYRLSPPLAQGMIV